MYGQFGEDDDSKEIWRARRSPHHGLQEDGWPALDGAHAVTQELDVGTASVRGLLACVDAPSSMRGVE